MKNRLYEILANSLEYPDKDWNTRLDRCRQWLTIQEPAVAVQFIRFRQRIADLPTETLQELYTQTFDLNPVCTLDVGYHLFGENYKRGELLARLRETEAAYEIDPKNQLPDHLPVLLRLLTRLEDKELRTSLIVEILLPALQKMLEALCQTDNPYRDLVEVISETLKNNVPEEATLSGAQTDETPELYRISSTAAAKH